MKWDTNLFCFLLCFLFLGVSSQGEEECSSSQQKDSACSGSHERGTVETLEDEMKIELLQRDLSLRSGSDLEAGTPKWEEVTPKPWPCDSKKLSYQTTVPPDNSKTVIASWTPSGSYEPVLTIWPKKATVPPFRSLNACGFNPINSVMYCALVITNRGTYLVSVDPDGTIGYVDKLRGSRYAATFDNEGNYYCMGKDYHVAVVPKVQDRKVFSSWSGLDAHVHEEPWKSKIGEKIVKVKEYGRMTERPHLGADFAYFEADVRGRGKERFLASLTQDVMKLLCISCDPFEVDTLKIQATNLPAWPTGKPRVWGTAWAYRNTTSIYFSADDGVGLYVTSDLSFKWNEKKVWLNRAGNAESTPWNDGLSCGVEEPWGKDDVGCTKKMYRSHSDRTTNTDKPVSYVRVIDPETGKIDKEWDIQGIYMMNACGINPVDNRIYCCVHPDVNNKNLAFLARLDTKGNIGYLHAYPPWQKGGTFDKDGNYWIFGPQFGLFKFPDVAKLTAIKEWSQLGDRIHWPKPDEVGFMDETLGKSFLDEFGDKKTTGKSGDKIGSDMVVASWPDVTTGEKRWYLISLVGTEIDASVRTQLVNRMSVVDITDDKPKEALILYDTDQTLPVPLEKTPKGQTAGSMTWGSAWRLVKKPGQKPEFLFASDDGQGMFRLVGVNITAGSVQFEKTTAKADIIEQNDGLSCDKEDVIDEIFVADE